MAERLRRVTQCTVPGLYNRYTYSEDTLQWVLLPSVLNYYSRLVCGVSRLGFDISSARGSIANDEFAIRRGITKSGEGIGNTCSSGVTTYVLRRRPVAGLSNVSFVFHRDGGGNTVSGVSALKVEGVTLKARLSKLFKLARFGVHWLPKSYFNYGGLSVQELVAEQLHLLMKDRRNVLLIQNIGNSTQHHDVDERRVEWASRGAGNKKHGFLPSPAYTDMRLDCSVRTHGGPGS
ncbi:hypothetical protein C8J55DRAFT_492354 [Lentinula edodes]|uniref:Uncharacterized protein n=1 Tax=Lentinula lateritia TaxID=40482 RepID=A0A9W8ZXJ2_9AGAR|nr:hypothetical protein C8J55DRAFT_492354 [Lentinula edodes]